MAGAVVAVLAGAGLRSFVWWDVGAGCRIGLRLSLVGYDNTTIKRALATLKHGSPEVALRGRLEMNYRSLLILTFGGGTNEIQRDLIGLFGLGLPRVLRG